MDPHSLGAFLQAYPEPALWLAPDGSVREANGSFALLPRTEDVTDWWASLREWALCPPDKTLDLSTTIRLSRRSVILVWLRTDLVDGSVLLTSRDMTAATNLNQALADSRHRFRDLADMGADFAWETDAEGRFVYVSPDGALGWPAASLVGCRADDLLAEEAAVDAPFRSERPIREVDLPLRARDGQTVWVTASIRPLSGPQGAAGTTRGVWREVTEARSRNAELARTQMRDRLLIYLGDLLRDSAGPEDRLDEAAKVIARAVGAAAVTLLRRGGGSSLQVPGSFIAHDLLNGKPPPVLSRTEAIGLLEALEAGGPGKGPERRDWDPWHVTAVATRYRQKVNGALVITLPAMRGGLGAADLDTLFAIAGQLGLANSNAAFVEQLRFQAERDELTGLYNRRAMIGFLEEQVEQANPGALVFVDLNNFKQVNDRLGHQRGDEVLHAIAGNVASAMVRGDRAARIGGDEFLLWLGGATMDRTRDVCDCMASFVRDLLTPAESRATDFGLAVGAVWSCGKESVDSLIARADKLMYEAKAEAKSDDRRATVIALDDGSGAAPY